MEQRLTHGDFQRVHDYSANGVIALDVNGLIVYANPRAVRDYFVEDGCLGQASTNFFNYNLRKSPDHPDLLANLLTEEEFLLRTAAGKDKNVLVSSAR